MRGARLLGLAALLISAAAAAEEAAPRFTLRVGDHPGFGRVVLDVPSGTAPRYSVERNGERLRLRLPADAVVDVSKVRRVPRNVAALLPEQEGLAIALRGEQVRVRHYLLDSRIVIDLHDASGTDTPRPATPPRDGSRTARNEPHTETTSGVPRTRSGTLPAAAATLSTTALPAAMAPSDATAQVATPPHAPLVAQASTPATDAASSATPAAATRRPRDAGGTSARGAGSGSAASSARDEPVPVLQEGLTAAARTAEAPRPDPTADARLPAAASGIPLASAVLATAVEAGAGQGAEPPPAVRLAPADATAVRLVFGPRGQPPAMVLPFGEEAGIAVLRRGETILVVLDVPRPLNLAALRGDPVFAGTEARTVAGGTVLSLRLAAPAGLTVRRRDGAWTLTPNPAVPAPPDQPGIEVRTDAAGRHLLLPAPNAGRIVAVNDPETGLPLLVGTVRDAGLAVPQLRRLPEVDLLPTLVGLAALARSDRITLRVTPEGIAIATATGSLALDAAVTAMELAPGMTRLFAFPSLPVAMLFDRLRGEQAAIRAAPPLARAPLRRAAAETLLALGLPHEAQGMLAIALSEDPAAAEDPILAALSGAAALIAGRPSEAEGLSRDDLPARDETILWRGLRDAVRGEMRNAASALAATLPLVLTYPEGLRARLLAPVAEALAEGGEVAALRRLVAGGVNRPELALARARLDEAEGRRDEALNGYAQVAEGRDRRARAQALGRATEARLAAGSLTPAEAAQALEASLFAWRGDAWEINQRLRIAALRQEAGDLLGAMALLRETEQLFPETREAVRPRIEAVFLEALAREAPLAAVALHDAHPDLLPPDARGEAALITLAERLLALDLPGRAAVLLRGAMDRAAAGSPQRAELGLRLAEVHLSEGEAAAALAALSASSADALPAPLARMRAIAAARAESRLGNGAAAIAGLRALGTEGTEPLAELLAAARDWAGAARAQATHLEATLPPLPAPLRDEDRRGVLRLAALMALSGEAEGLRHLAATQGTRMAEGPLADAFAALTADPLQGVADLPRLQRELRLFRELPGRLEALRAPRLATR